MLCAYLLLWPRQGIYSYMAKSLPLTSKQITSRLRFLAPTGVAFGAAQGDIVRHVFTNGDWRGECDPEIGYIELNVKCMLKRLKRSRTRDLLEVDRMYLSTVLHELVHCMAFEAGIYKKFHSGADVSGLSAVRAEKWVDRQAKAWFDTLGLDCEYEDSYLSFPENIEWLREQYNK